MKQILFLLIFTLLVITQVDVLAQRKDNDKERWERYRTEKVAFLTNTLDFTPEEAQKFWPVYNQMEKERSEFQSNRHKLDRKVRESSESLSDEEIIRLTREFVSNQKKEGELAEKYNEEFLKILPPQKVLNLYKAEGEFRMHMFKKFRENRQKGKEHP